jgi:hypothetical protein
MMVKQDNLPFNNRKDDTSSPEMNANSDDIANLAPFERWLDNKLKTVYGAVLEEEIPDDLINLLREKLDKKD